MVARRSRQQPDDDRDRDAQQKDGLVKVGALSPVRARLTAEEFQGLATVPAEAEWFANIDNPRTRRAYELDLKDFMSFVGISRPEEFRVVTRAHVIAWRKSLEQREQSPSTIRRKLAALSSLYNYLAEKNSIAMNPVDGVKRPKADGNEGKTPAIGDAQARRLLDAPDPETVKGKRDRAILAVFLFHALRAEELCRLKVKDLQRLDDAALRQTTQPAGRLADVPRRVLTHRPVVNVTYWRLVPRRRAPSAVNTLTPACDRAASTSSEGGGGGWSDDALLAGRLLEPAGSVQKKIGLLSSSPLFPRHVVVDG